MRHYNAEGVKTSYEKIDLKKLNKFIDKLFKEANVKKS